MALVTVATSGWLMSSESELVGVMAVLIPDIFEVEWCYKLSGATVSSIITIPPRFFEMTSKPSVLQSGPRE